MRGRSVALIVGMLFVAILGVVPLLYLFAVIGGLDEAYASPSSVSEAMTTVLRDSANYTTLARSIVFAVTASLIQFTVALFLSRVLFTKKIKTNRYLYLLVLPLGITPIAAALMWKSLFDYQFGPLNHLILAIGGSRIPWLSTGSPFGTPSGFSELNWGQISILIADSWLWIPFLLGAMLVAFSRVPVDLLESAGLEGANKGRIFWSVVVPSSRSFLLLFFFLRFVDSFRLFDADWAFFGASPVSAHLSARVYSQMFLERDYTLATCFAVIGTLVITPISTWLLSLIRRSMIVVSEDS